MAYQEKSAWIMVLTAVLGYLSYLVILFASSAQAPLLEVEYVPIMVCAIGGSIIGSILLHIVVGIFSPQDRGKKGARDREIGRFGEYTGQAFLVLGGVGALILAMFEAGYFWIANSLYLAFVCSAVLSSMAKIVGYRKGFQAW